MKQKITINDKSYDVEVGDLMSSPVRVTVNGKDYDVVVETIGSVPPPSSPSIPTIAAPVFKPAAAPTPKPAATGSAGAGGEIYAPMPGTIVEINVQVGSQVKAGQQVVGLEAMKMKNAIRANKDGVISSVEVTLNQKVSYGDVLVRIE